MKQNKDLNKLLEQMHPADLADIVEELGPEDRQAIFENMDREAAAEALAELPGKDELRAMLLAEVAAARDLGAQRRLVLVLDAQLHELDAAGQQADEPVRGIDDEVEAVEHHNNLT